MFSEIWQAIVDIFKPVPQKPIIPPIPDTYANRAVNRKAALYVIGWSEGTVQIPHSDNGYQALVGGGTFSDYSQHPRKLVWIPRIGKYSDAAGRYQILFRQWGPYIETLGLKDFSPQYQDIWAMNALREINALDDIDAGRFESFVAKAGNRWASFPGSKFGQSDRTMQQLKDVYSIAGGQFAA